MKRETGSSTSDEQVAWAETLATCAEAINECLDEPGVMPERQIRVHYRLWRPRDGDEIAALLSFGRVSEWAL